MRKTRVISVRLDDRDYQDLVRLVADSTFTPAELMRHLIRNATIRPPIIRTEVDSQKQKEPA